MPKVSHRKEGSKRDKYTSQACFECQRRKIKCSGEPVCSSCRTRNIECCYAGTDHHDDPRPTKRARKESPAETSPPSCPRKRTKTSVSLKEQLLRLQEQVNALSKAQIQNEAKTLDTAPVKAVSAGISDSDQSPRAISPSPVPIANGDYRYYSSNDSPSSSRGNPSPSKRPTESNVNETTSPQLNSLPIDSQLSALRKLRRGSSLGNSGNSSLELLATVTLPEPHVLWDLVGQFFQAFESYFPCLNRDMIYERLSAILSVHGYGDGRHQITIGSRDCKILAILLNMLAYAESLILPIESGNQRPISQSYLQGLKLMQHFSQLHCGDLETVIYHTTSSAYLLEMSMHHMALQSTTQGFQIALQIGLNNQDLWPNDDSELASRQGLWWTVYFLDKRLTQKCGITYFLREDESAVSDFSNLNHTLSSRNHETLQALVLFSRLWALIWDGFFSPQAPKADDWRESQMMDTRIVIEYRQIPTKLHWKSSMVSEYIFTDGETHARQRLIVFLRFQSLRLSIRHKTLSSDEHDVERRKTVITICEAIVEAIRSYMVTAAWLKPLGYILTTALVECLYYILPEECHPTPVVSNKLLKDLICDASQALQSLSKLVATASKIYQSLKDLLPSDNALDSFDASSHDQQAVDQTMPLNCFSDLDAMSETFWEGFSNKFPIPKHMEPSHRAIPLLSMGPSEIFTTEGLPVHFDDLQSQILSDLSLDNTVFGAFPFDYKTAQFEKDQLSRPFGSI